MIKAVIFDMDGVLVDSEPVFLGCARNFFEENDVYAAEEKINAMVGCSITAEQRILADLWNEGRDEHRESSDVYDEFLKYREDYFERNNILYSDMADTDARDVIHMLKEQGYKVAIASSSPLKKIEEMAEQLRLQQYIDLIVSGEMFKESKPNPEIYLHTVKSLELEPEECVAVEDSEFGIAAAKAAGVMTVAKIERRYNFSQDAADYKIERLTGIFQVLNT